MATNTLRPLAQPSQLQSLWRCHRKQFLPPNGPRPAKTKGKSDGAKVAEQNGQRINMGQECEESSFTKEISELECSARGVKLKDDEEKSSSVGLDYPTIQEHIGYVTDDLHIQRLYRFSVMSDHTGPTKVAFQNT